MTSVPVLCVPVSSPSVMRARSALARSLRCKRAVGPHVCVPGERTCGHSSEMRVQRADTARVGRGRAAFVWACYSQRRKPVVAKKPPIYEHLPCGLRGWGDRT